MSELTARQLLRQGDAIVGSVIKADSAWSSEAHKAGQPTLVIHCGILMLVAASLISQ